jgi:hypothetical protein
MAKHIMIAVPAYTWSVTIPTMRSVIADMTLLMQRGDKVSLFDESGSTDLPDARAVMVGHFLKSDATHLVSLDNDICWQAGALLKLIDYPVDMVAGVYPKRKDPIEYPVRWLPTPTLQADPETGLLEVEAAPGGFVRYTRNCLETMTANYPSLRFKSTRYGTEDDLYALFEPMFIDGRRMGEDFAFCRRWRDIGGQVWINPEIKMGHIGPKMFEGHLGHWLRNRA